MAHIIKQFSFRQEVTFTHDFQRIGEARGTGYSFDVNEPVLNQPLTLKHDVFPDLNTAEQREFREKNYAEVKKDSALEDLGIIRHERRVKDHSVLMCDCGNEVVLYYPENDCECGRRYNLFGQGLRTNYSKAEEMEEFSYGDWNDWQ